MATNKTANIGLSQWEPDDPVLREDFNHDNQVIDRFISGLGSCEIQSSGYTGTGEASRSRAFSVEPLLLIIQGCGVTIHILRGETTVISQHSQGNSVINVTRETLSPTLLSVKWEAQSGKPSDACNSLNENYSTLAFYDRRE